MVTAEKYLKKHKKVKIIVSGGQGSGEQISEALAMYKYLVAHGIDRDRIIQEDKSRSTYENIKNSFEIIKNKGDKLQNIAVLTSNFHVFRAVKLAQKVGAEDIKELVLQHTLY